VVTSAITPLGFSGAPRPLVQLDGVLSVDMGLSRDGRRFAVASLGTMEVTLGRADRLGGDAAPETVSAATPGEPVAVAFAGDRVVVQLREPAGLWLPDLEPADAALLRFPGVSRRDTGHEAFHRAAPARIACASCHPEGAEDGHVWQFDAGPRRTQALGGGLLATAPFHWDGAMAGVQDLVHEVFTRRMGGKLQPDQVGALERWLDTLPGPAAPPARDAVAVARGRELFTGAAGCAACHAGARLTSNASVDVGTGGMFQVPSLLGVWARAPYLHDGCAVTLRDRFGPCGGAAHGITANLSSTQVDDLVAYLEGL
jgi:mono/diheme cytochrome c family protein